MIYADNAATTRVSDRAIRLMTLCMKEVWGNPSSLHAAGQEARKTLYAARRSIAGCIGALPEEIYFTSGGSEADNQAIMSAAKYRKGNHIISTKIEHHAVLNTLKRLSSRGYEVELLDVGHDGIVTPSQVANAIREDTCLVTIMAANNEIGTIQPIAPIGKICRDKGVLFHTDGVQAVGHIPINIADQNIDMLSFSAHKFHGPKGIGVLFARRGISLEKIIEGGSQERGKRAGTENVPAIVGMASALEDAVDAMDENTKKVMYLRDMLINGLSGIPGSFLNGDSVRRLPGNVNFSFLGIEGEALLIVLNNRGICASTGSACTSGSVAPSHVLLSIGRPLGLAHGSIRLTLGEDNTEDEVREIIHAVKDSVLTLRGRGGRNDQ